MKKQTSLFLTMISLWGIQVQVMVAPPAGFSAPAERNNTSPQTPENNQGPRSEESHFPSAQQHEAGPQNYGQGQEQRGNERQNEGRREPANARHEERGQGQHEKPVKETIGEINEEASKEVIPVTQKPHYSVTSGIDFDDKEEAEDVGLVDTTDSTSGGNWLLKRIWGEKTEDVFSQIKDAVKKIMEMRIAFFNQRNDIDKKFDQFYQQLGFEQGPFEDILNFALEVYDKAKKDGLSEKERAFYQTIQEKQSKIEQLKKDVEAIIVLDGKINDALDVVLQQIDLSNKYEDKAWENFRDILRELNDKEARIQYYETKGILDDVNKIAAYLSGPFSQYFSQSTQSAQEHMKNILSQIDLLKKDGVDLTKEADLLEKEDEEAIQAAAQEKEAAQKAQKEKEMAAKNKPVPVKKEAWWSVVPNFFVGIYQKSIDGIMSLFGGNKKVVQTKVPAQKGQVKGQSNQQLNEQFNQPLKNQKQNQKQPIETVKKETGIMGTLGGWLYKSTDFFVSAYHTVIDALMNLFGGNKKTVAVKVMPKKIQEERAPQQEQPVQQNMQQQARQNNHQEKAPQHQQNQQQMQQQEHEQNQRQQPVEQQQEERAPQNQQKNNQQELQNHQEQAPQRQQNQQMQQQEHEQQPVRPQQEEQNQVQQQPSVNHANQPAEQPGMQQNAQPTTQTTEQAIKH